ncbi:hypothetical protein KSP40_PGU020806 [Platanthera guangdongensis]|uniref:Helicase ATP-binding domain-containing protein n=1 Tax=Platanthera guangdongensis TaxID=2320717 RepID=A0ABR2MVD0_9ASPA
MKKTEEYLDERGNEFNLMPFSSDSDEEEREDLSREKDPSFNGDGDEERAEDSPLLFGFDDGAAKGMEKTEYDEGLDELWCELDFALQSLNVGEYGDSELQDDIHCSGGDHEFVLDEQIGIICKLCSFVHQEIKYVLPSLAKNGAKSSANNSSAATKDPQFSSTFGDVFAQLRNEWNKSNCDNVATGTVWDHVPGVHQTLYAHQREAFEFMWRNLAGSIRLRELQNPAPGNVRSGGGCIISHAPGTGKSRLAIVFIQSFLKQFPDCRPVIIAPRGMLLTWEKEFKKWKIGLAFHNLNTGDFAGDEGRLGKLCSWKRGNGVLALSYSLFTKLITGKHAKNSEGYVAGQFLLNQPGLIVFDEGHIPRNHRSLLWKAVKKVKTLNRIGLSGTPFQNNLRELSNTMRLVRPGLGKLLANILNPFHSIERKKKKNADVDDEKIGEIKSAIKPFVHVHGGAILETLPGLRECLILLNPPERQRIVLENLNNKSGLDVYAEHKLCMASIHPSLLTLACGEGISLVGASRIVLLDVLWNPSVERQAISRAYRIGQVRFVYTYQLILNGTGERDKYKKQVCKDRLSEMLFSIENDDAEAPISSKCMKERAAKFISEDKILEEMIGNQELKEMFIKLHFPAKKSAALAAFGEDADDAGDGEDQLN